MGKQRGKPKRAGGKKTRSLSKSPSPNGTSTRHRIPPSEDSSPSSPARVRTPRRVHFEDEGPQNDAPMSAPQSTDVAVVSPPGENASKKRKKNGTESSANGIGKQSKTRKSVPLDSREDGSPSSEKMSSTKQDDSATKEKNAQHSTVNFDVMGSRPDVNVTEPRSSGPETADLSGPDPRDNPFAKLVGIGDASDSDDEAQIETLAVADLPTETIVDARIDESALKRKLVDVAIFDVEAAVAPLPFRESLAVSMKMELPLPPELAVDDLEREKRIAELTTAAVHDGLDRLRKEKFKFRRSSDYFAEMVKTDEQMGKIKSRLLSEKENIEAAEKRRNNRDIKKNRKKVRQDQMEKQQDKRRQINEQIAAVNRVRKQRLRDREEGKHSDDDEFPIEMMDIEQLDVNNQFQKHGDIASGKQKPWRSNAQNGFHNGIQRGGREGGRNGRGKDMDWKDHRGGRGTLGKSAGLEVRGGVKKRSPMQRLGKNRRKRVANH